jgi:FHA domain
VAVSGARFMGARSRMSGSDKPEGWPFVEPSKDAPGEPEVGPGDGAASTTAWLNLGPGPHPGVAPDTAPASPDAESVAAAWLGSVAAQEPPAPRPAEPAATTGWASPFAGSGSAAPPTPAGGTSDWDLDFDVPAPTPAAPAPAAAPEPPTVSGLAPPPLFSGFTAAPPAPPVPVPAPATSPAPAPALGQAGATASFDLGGPAPAAPPAATALELEVTVGQRTVEIPLDLDELLIGRADPSRGVHPGVDLSMDDAVSRRHARLARRGGRYFLADLGSTNGTKLNNRWLEPHRETPISAGDRIELGALTTIFVLEVAARDA